MPGDPDRRQGFARCGRLVTRLASVILTAGCAAVRADLPRQGSSVSFDRAERAAHLIQRADSGYRAGAYDLGARLYVAAAADWTDPADLHFKAARSHARAGRTEAALAALQAAIRAGHREPEQLVRDSALTVVRGARGWSDIVKASETNRRRYWEAHRDPEAAQLVTSDIGRFWLAYDEASKQPTSRGRVAVYRKMYFNRGSDGLLDYYLIKIRSIESFVATIDSYPRYYRSLREGSQQVLARVDAIRGGLRKMKAIYADAVFPNVYFVIGRLTSAGTLSHRGLLLGIEKLTATKGKTPLDEFSEARRPWGRGVESIPPVVAHELVHFQQKNGPYTLLRNVLTEGGADFIGELIAGGNTNPVAQAFGNAHEAEVWHRFEKDMHGTDARDWLANSSSDRVGPTWVPDLGYFVGYQISKAYYERATDKRQALRDLLDLEDPDAILRASGYPERFTR